MNKKAALKNWKRVVEKARVRNGRWKHIGPACPIYIDFEWVDNGYGGETLASWMDINGVKYYDREKARAEVKRLGYPLREFDDWWPAPICCH